MRLTLMNRSLLAAALLLASAPVAAPAQSVAGPAGSGDHFKDTTPLKLPNGARVAIYDFEDLECPACARAFPVVHTAIDRYKIPLVRHDFPLQMHVWSRDAAITARYLQDKVSPDAAEQFRRDVFASQQSINSKDDLGQFTHKWFAMHNQKEPFALGPNSLQAAEVQADYTLGERIGLVHTPTIFVLSSKGWTQVTDVTQLYTTIDTALAQSPAATTKASNTPHNNLRKAPGIQR